MSSYSAAPPDRSVPPHDLEAEQAVLGALMLTSEAIAEVEDILTAEDFHLERHRCIFTAAITLSQRAEPIDPLSLRGELDRQGTLSRSGGVEYIAELSGVTPTAAHVRHYARIVAAHALRRRLLASLEQARSVASNESIEAQEAVAQVDQIILGVSDQQQHTEASHVAPLLAETWDHLEVLLGGQRFITGVPTRFSDLDTATQGLQPDELIILAARPSVGKSAFCLNVARNAAVMADVPVAVFSLEMSRQSLIQRLLCSEAHVDGYLLKTGQADAATFSRVAQAMDRLNSAPLWIDDTPGLSLAALRARARRMKARHGIGLIVVDYLQLMRSGSRGESREQEVAEISRGLKAMAKEMHVPVLALSQLSRESERRSDRRPQLSDLRDSGSLEQDADVVLFLYREGMHNQEVDKSATQLIIAKNRNGPVRDIDLVFIAEQTAFREPYRGTPPIGGKDRAAGDAA